MTQLDLSPGIVFKASNLNPVTPLWEIPALMLTSKLSVLKILHAKCAFKIIKEHPRSYNLRTRRQWNLLYIENAQRG